MSLESFLFTWFSSCWIRLVCRIYQGNCINIIKWGRSWRLPGLDRLIRWDLERWRVIISPIFYVCSYFGISSAVSQRVWVQVISRYTREVGSLTGTSLEPVMGSCEKPWELLVYNMDLRIRVRVSRALYFHWCSYAFIVTNETQTCQNLQNIGGLFPLSRSRFRYKTVSVSSISLRSSFFLTCSTMNIVLNVFYVWNRGNQTTLNVPSIHMFGVLWESRTG